MNYKNLAQPWQQSTAAAPHLPVRKTPPFYLMHHPHNWEIVIFEKLKKVTVDKKRETVSIQIPLWLPKLTVFTEIPGCNNVVSNGNRIDSSYARMQFEDRGFTILNHREHDYLRIYPAIGGNYHTTKFEELELIGGRVLKSNNEQESNNWRRELVLNGSIAAPHQGILKIIKQNALVDRNRHAQKPHIPQEVDEMKRIDSLILSMETATANLLKEGLKSYVI